MGGNSRTLRYLYDKNGNRDHVTHLDNNYFKYTFDGINRVNAVTENATTMLSLTYQPNGRRKMITRDGSSTTYTFDDVGRLKTLAQAFASTTHNLTSTFTYNAANQITVLDKNNAQYDYLKNENRTGGFEVNGLNQYLKINGQPLGYDINGNLTNDGATIYTYDMENRLVATSGNVTSTLKYDPLGRLFEFKIGTVTTQFLYDGDALVGEYSSLMGGGLRQRYVHGDQVDEPWVQYGGSSVSIGFRTYLHADHQGSIIAHGDPWGGVSNKLKYDSYGIPDTTNVERFGYTGQLWFKDLGLFHYKARMYSPKLGRFLQTDPIFYADQMNIYAYVRNDPVNMVDPHGEFGQEFHQAMNGNMNPASNAAGMQANAMKIGRAEMMAQAPILAGTMRGINVVATVIAIAAATVDSPEIASTMKVAADIAGVQASALDAALAGESVGQAVAIEVASNLVGGALAKAGGTIAGGLASSGSQNMVKASTEVADVLISREANTAMEEQQKRLNN